MAPKRGRPPLPDEERRDWIVSVRLNAAEYEALARWAEELGVSLSQAAGDALRRVLKRRARR